MNFYRCLAIALALSTVTLAMPAPGWAAGNPHIINGLARDSAGGTIGYVNVTVTKIVSGEKLYTVSDGQGLFQVDLSHFPSGYSNGNVLSVKGTYGTYSAETNVTVDSSVPSQYAVLTFPCKSHVIAGFVKYSYGSPGSAFPVSVLNLVTSKAVDGTTDSTGLYRLELAFLQGGFAVGVGLEISSQKNGFKALVNRAVDASQVQWVNLTLTDIQSPSITDPRPGEWVVGSPCTVTARIWDNNATTSATIFYMGVSSGFYTALALLQDDGALRDWDGNHVQTLGLYGAILPAQTAPGYVRYYIEASDGTNTVTNPLVNASAQPRQIAIRDVTAPSVSATIPASVEVGLPRAMSASIQDNVAVSSAWLNYTPPGGSAATIPLAWTGVGNAYEGTLPALHALGALTFSAHAADSSGNIGRAPLTGTFSTNVVDTTPPTATHVPVNSMTAGSQAAVIAHAADNLALGPGRLLVKGVGQTAFAATALNLAGGDYNGSLPAQAITGTMRYYIELNDTSGNSMTLPAGGAASPYQVLVVDAGTPSITHEPVAAVPVHEPLVLTAYIEDDVLIGNATLAFLGAGNATYTTKEMTKLDGVASRGNFSCAIPAQASLGELRYVINATDGTNSMSHPAIEPFHSVQVIDITPTVMASVMPFVLALGAQVEFECNVSDDVEVGEVRVRFSESGTGDWTWLDMVYEGSLANKSGRYSAAPPSGAFPADRPMTVAYYFSANDTSGNSATLPAANATTGPLLLSFIDGDAPAIAHEPMASYPLNRTIELGAAITDDVGVEWAQVYYTFDQGVLAAATMAKGDDGRFTARLPPAMRSGNLTYRISAGDASLVNQSQLFTVPCVNGVPGINATGTGDWPVSTEINVSATITDDVGVRKASICWMGSAVPQGEAMRLFSLPTHPMQRIAGTDRWFATIPAQEAPIYIDYYIIAWDDETTSVSGTVLNLSVVDITPPAISHAPAESYAAGTSPILTAVVSDDVAVSSVAVQYRNGDADFAPAHMELAQSSVNGTYVVQLPALEAGILEYYIVASDGTNEARIPASDGEYCSVAVEAKAIDYTPYYVVAIVAVLTAVALIMVYRTMRAPRRKQ